MKKRKYIYPLKYKLLLGILMLSTFIFAQPSPGGDYGPPDLPDKDTVMGGSAPIDGGMLLLIGFALLYLLFKYQEELVLFLKNLKFQKSL